MFKNKAKKIKKEEAIEDVEEAITKKWSDGIKGLEVLEIKRKKDKINKKKIIDGVYNFAFQAKEKTAKAKFETNKKLSSRLWVAKFTAFSIIALIFSIFIAHFSPENAKAIQEKFDLVLLRPAKEIKALAIKHDLVKSTCESKEEESPDRVDLANYIKENQSKLEVDRTGRIKTLKITQDDLLGRVAGVEEKTEIEAESGAVYKKTKEFLILAGTEISDKQKELSLDFSNRLKRALKNIKN